MKKSDIISRLQAKEASLLLDFNTYVSRALENIAGEFDLYEFWGSDTGYLARRAAWEAISETLYEMGLGSDIELDDYRRAVYISVENDAAIHEILRRRDA